MKKKKIAFTMIELLVVISIISIISVTSINGFFNFLQNKELNLKTNEISLYIESLDKKIKNHEIFDYNIIINSNINNSFISYENVYDTDPKATLDYNLNNSGAINLVGSNSDIWNLTIYKDKKLFNTENITGNSKNINFDENYNYKIISSLSGTTDIKKLNNIDLIRFDKESSVLKLINIYSDIGTNAIGNIEIKNIGGKKEFYNSGLLLDKNEVYLYFENKGKENYLKLTK